MQEKLGDPLLHTKQLSADHMVTFYEVPGSSPLDYLKEVGAIVGSSHIHSFCKYEGFIKIYLTDKIYVKEITDTEITILGRKLCDINSVPSYTYKVEISNVDPIISDFYLENFLKTYGILESPIVHQNLSKSADFAHIDSDIRCATLRTYKSCDIPVTFEFNFKGLLYKINVAVKEQPQSKRDVKEKLRLKDYAKDDTNISNDLIQLSNPLWFTDPTQFPSTSKIRKASKLSVPNVKYKHVNKYNFLSNSLECFNNKIYVGSNENSAINTVPIDVSENTSTVIRGNNALIEAVTEDNFIIIGSHKNAELVPIQRKQLSSNLKAVCDISVPKYSVHIKSQKEKRQKSSGNKDNILAKNLVQDQLCSIDDDPVFTILDADCVAENACLQNKQNSVGLNSRSETLSFEVIENNSDEVQFIRQVLSSPKKSNRLKTWIKPETAASFSKNSTTEKELAQTLHEDRNDKQCESSSVSNFQQSDNVNTCQNTEVPSSSNDQTAFFNFILNDEDNVQCIQLTQRTDIKAKKGFDDCENVKLSLLPSLSLNDEYPHFLLETSPSIKFKNNVEENMQSLVITDNPLFNITSGERTAEVQTMNTLSSAKTFPYFKDNLNSNQSHSVAVANKKFVHSSSSKESAFDFRLRPYWLESYNHNQTSLRSFPKKNQYGCAVSNTKQIKRSSSNKVVKVPQVILQSERINSLLSNSISSNPKQTKTDVVAQTRRKITETNFGRNLSLDDTNGKLQAQAISESNESSFSQSVSSRNLYNISNKDHLLNQNNCGKKTKIVTQFLLPSSREIFVPNMSTPINYEATGISDNLTSEEIREQLCQNHPKEESQKLSLKIIHSPEKDVQDSAAGNLHEIKASCAPTSNSKTRGSSIEIRNESFSLTSSPTPNLEMPESLVVKPILGDHISNDDISIVGIVRRSPRFTCSKTANPILKFKNFAVKDISKSFENKSPNTTANKKLSPKATSLPNSVESSAQMVHTSRNMEKTPIKETRGGKSTSGLNKESVKETRRDDPNSKIQAKSNTSLEKQYSLSINLDSVEDVMKNSEKNSLEERIECPIAQSSILPTDSPSLIKNADLHNSATNSSEEMIENLFVKIPKVFNDTPESVQASASIFSNYEANIQDTNFGKSFNNKDCDVNKNLKQLSTPLKNLEDVCSNANLSGSKCASVKRKSIDTSIAELTAKKFYCGQLSGSFKNVNLTKARIVSPNKPSSSILMCSPNVKSNKRSPVSKNLNKNSSKKILTHKNSLSVSQQNTGRIVSKLGTRIGIFTSSNQKGHYKGSETITKKKSKPKKNKEVGKKSKTPKSSSMKARRCISEYEFTSSDSDSNDLSYSKWRSQLVTPRKRSPSSLSSNSKSLTLVSEISQSIRPPKIFHFKDSNVNSSKSSKHCKKNTLQIKRKRRNSAESTNKRIYDPVSLKITLKTQYLFEKSQSKTSVSNAKNGGPKHGDEKKFKRLKTSEFKKSNVDQIKLVNRTLESANEDCSAFDNSKPNLSTPCSSDQNAIKTISSKKRRSLITKYFKNNLNSQTPSTLLQEEAINLSLRPELLVDDTNASANADQRPVSSEISSCQKVTPSKRDMKDKEVLGSSSFGPTSISTSTCVMKINKRPKKSSVQTPLNRIHKTVKSKHRLKSDVRYMCLKNDGKKIVLKKISTDSGLNKVSPINSETLPISENIELIEQAEASSSISFPVTSTMDQFLTNEAVAVSSSQVNENNNRENSHVAEAILIQENIKTISENIVLMGHAESISKVSFPTSKTVDKLTNETEAASSSLVNENVNREKDNSIKENLKTTSENIALMGQLESSNGVNFPVRPSTVNRLITNETDSPSLSLKVNKNSHFIGDNLIQEKISTTKQVQAEASGIIERSSPSSQTNLRNEAFVKREINRDEFAINTTIELPTTNVTIGQVSKPEYSSQGSKSQRLSLKPTVSDTDHCISSIPDLSIVKIEREESSPEIIELEDDLPSINTIVNSCTTNNIQNVNIGVANKMKLEKRMQITNIGKVLQPAQSFTATNVSRIRVKVETEEENVTSLESSELIVQVEDRNIITCSKDVLPSNYSMENSEILRMKFEKTTSHLESTNCDNSDSFSNSLVQTPNTMKGIEQQSINVINEAVQTNACLVTTNSAAAPMKNNAPIGNASLKIEKQSQMIQDSSKTRLETISTHQAQFNSKLELNDASNENIQAEVDIVETNAIGFPDQLLIKDDSNKVAEHFSNTAKSIEQHYSTKSISSNSAMNLSHDDSMTLSILSSTNGKNCQAKSVSNNIALKQEAVGQSFNQTFEEILNPDEPSLSDNCYSKAQAKVVATSTLNGSSNQICPIDAGKSEYHSNRRDISKDLKMEKNIQVLQQNESVTNTGDHEALGGEKSLHQKLPGTSRDLIPSKSLKKLELTAVYPQPNQVDDTGIEVSTAVSCKTSSLLQNLKIEALENEMEPDSSLMSAEDCQSNSKPVALVRPHLSDLPNQVGSMYATNSTSGASRNLKLEIRKELSIENESEENYRDHDKLNNSKVIDFGVASVGVNKSVLSSEDSKEINIEYVESVHPVSHQMHLEDSDSSTFEGLKTSSSVMKVSNKMEVLSENHLEKTDQEIEPLCGGTVTNLKMSGCSSSFEEICGRNITQSNDIGTHNQSDDSLKKACLMDAMPSTTKRSKTSIVLRNLKAERNLELISENESEKNYAELEPFYVNVTAQSETLVENTVPKENSRKNNIKSKLAMVQQELKDPVSQACSMQATGLTSITSDTNTFLRNIKIENESSAGDGSESETSCCSETTFPKALQTIFSSADDNEIDFESAIVESDTQLVLNQKSLLPTIPTKNSIASSQHKIKRSIEENDQEELNDVSVEDSFETNISCLEKDVTQSLNKQLGAKNVGISFNGSDPVSCCPQINIKAVNNDEIAESFMTTSFQKSDTNEINRKRKNSTGAFEEEINFNLQHTSECSKTNKKLKCIQSCDEVISNFSLDGATRIIDSNTFLESSPILLSEMDLSSSNQMINVENLSAIQSFSILQESKADMKENPSIKPVQIVSPFHRRKQRSPTQISANRIKRSIFVNRYRQILKNVISSEQPLNSSPLLSSGNSTDKDSLPNLKPSTSDELILGCHPLSSMELNTPHSFENSEVCDFDTHSIVESVSNKITDCDKSEKQNFQKVGSMSFLGDSGSKEVKIPILNNSSEELLQYTESSCESIRFSSDERSSHLEDGEDSSSLKMNPVETFVVESVEVMPQYDDIYSVYKNLSTRVDTSIKPVLNYPLNEKKLEKFLEVVRRHKNPKKVALKVLENNQTPGALKELIVQLYDYFKVCNDSRKQLRISRLIMLLNDQELL